MRRIALLLLLPLLPGCSEREEKPRPERWVTYEDTAHAFRISFPASWQRSTEVLTPRLVNPHEIVSLATFPARPGDNGNCGHVPAGAAERMGSGDVLLTLQERRGSGGFTDRIRPFVLGPPRKGDMAQCAGRPDLRERDGGFRDAGRGLHVFATFAADAPEARRREAERIVESLVLEPTWRDRGLDLRMQPPTGWRVKARGSHLNFGSFEVPPPPDGACTLPRGVRDLPSDGAFAFVFEYVDLNRTQRMRFPAYVRFRLRARERRPYECFGESWMFRWRDKGRTFQAHVYLGERATDVRRRELLAALQSIAVTRRH